MKLTLDIAGQSHEAEFKRDGANVQLVLGEHTHSAFVSQPEAGFYTIILNDHVFRCYLDTQPNGQTEVVVNGSRFPVSVRDKKHRQANAGSAAAGGKAVLVAPMPGKVVRIMCAVGDEVTANQSLLVVEAMKMQNEVQTPKAGKVVELKVTEGQTVNAGETMVVVE